MTIAFNDNREADALRDIGTDFHEMVREATVWKHGKPPVARMSYYAALRAGRHVVQHIFRLFPDLRDEAMRGEIK